MGPFPPPPAPNTATLLTLPTELRLNILALALCLPAQRIISPCACLRHPHPNISPLPAVPPLSCSPPTALLARWQARMQASLESRLLAGSLSRVCRAVHAEVLELQHPSRTHGGASSPSMTFLFCAPKCLQFALHLMTPRQRASTASMEVLHWNRSLPAAYALATEAVRGFIAGEVRTLFEVRFTGGEWEAEVEEEGRGRGLFLVMEMGMRAKVRAKGEGPPTEESDHALSSAGRGVDGVERRVCGSPACTAA